MIQQIFRSQIKCVNSHIKTDKLFLVNPCHKGFVIIESEYKPGFMESGNASLVKAISSKALFEGKGAFPPYPVPLQGGSLQTSVNTSLL